MKYITVKHGERISVPLSAVNTDRVDGWSFVRSPVDGVVLHLDEHEKHNGGVLISYVVLRRMIRQIEESE